MEGRQNHFWFTFHFYPESNSGLAGLLTYPISDILPVRFGQTVDHLQKHTIPFGIGLTAAGTVPDSHRIPN